MQLPDNAVGPTDVREYRDCPRRFAFGMRRHTGAAGPEATSPSNAYGSAVHDALAYAEEHDCSDEEAIQHAFDRWAKWLEPEDLERLTTDLATYREREPTGVRCVAVEREVRIPLFEHNGEMIYLRGKLDRLYQRLDNEAVFVHVDYKSSRWPRTEAEVHEDIQLWAYNLLIHEEWPECETLVQLYDQLSHGVIPTRKTDEQREQIKQWLVHQITAILNDEELTPTLNDWCAWCPIMESCPVIEDLSDFALSKITALAPTETAGRKKVMKLDPSNFEVYVAELDKVGQAQKVLKRYDETVKGALKLMPTSQRAELGYEVRERGADVWTPEALRAAHDVLGDDDFYRAVGMSKTALEKALGKEDDRLTTVTGMATRVTGTTMVQKIKT